ncbi:hypothetical protein BJY04DRAFT_187653 [Aspergillus karnatakaensis]|uniref:uncharacterized protein n=1 Tax=Aspergillus karnatakaensis TaxID=1810916 RepID=UPI003CCD4FC0
MRFNLPSLLIAALSATPVLAGQQVLAVWSGSTFSTIGPSGEHVNTPGFTLVREDGDTIYNEAYPDGYDPCIFMGQEFQMEGGCLGGAWYSFRCIATQIGTPTNCEVMGPDGSSIGTGESDDQTDFFGLGISITGVCRVQFELADGIDCTTEPGDLAVHDTEWNRW